MQELSLEDLVAMDGKQLRAIMERALPFDPQAVENKQFLGSDLSLPKLGQKLLWQTFRKTFYRDPASGQLRGWNVRMEQHGLRGPQIPMRNRDGSEKSFGHYVVADGGEVRWPGGYTCSQYLDYSTIGNPITDPGRFTYSPLVAVNEGSSRLLLGWEVFRMAGVILPLPLYYALELAGDLEVVEPAPG